ncbi:signal peptidase II [Paenibacillus endoradicis]|uniref:signal peptidase II n=1 Tax=Paenibacillus endoradicis TaxID=2972487 RepID=UPI0021597C91|nr:signal peptidase II [Paenibacillus endoradicis]MCR8656022.1 signal peptidase II [Paenibacillus endoradicis]MCR8658348.1 signal peptidase II [Paenibacillus endoradicis]
MRFYYYVIAVVVLILDFFSKKWIVNNMKEYDQFSVIGDFFLITSHRNRGAAFGILQDQRVFFIIITIVIVGAIIWYAQSVRKSGSVLLLSGLGLVLGGAVGNFIDRARFGEVVDFFKFNFGSYTFPIFNVADSAIVVGVILIMLDTLLSMKEEKKGKVAVENE